MSCNNWVSRSDCQETLEGQTWARRNNKWQAWKIRSVDQDQRSRSRGSSTLHHKTLKRAVLLRFNMTWKYWNFYLTFIWRTLSHITSLWAVRNNKWQAWTILSWTWESLHCISQMSPRHKVQQSIQRSEFPSFLTINPPHVPHVSCGHHHVIIAPNNNFRWPSSTLRVTVSPCPRGWTSIKNIILDPGIIDCISYMLFPRTSWKRQQINRDNKFSLPHVSMSPCDHHCGPNNNFLWPDPSSSALPVSMSPLSLSLCLRGQTVVTSSDQWPPDTP